VKINENNNKRKTMDLTSLFERARAAGRKLLQLPVGRVDEILRAVADEALAQSEYILSENARDLERMSPDNPMYDRLKLTSARLEGIAADTRHVADLPSPLGRVLKHTVLPNGLDLKRVSVPFGVIGVIYEARPNVSFDVFSLCFKAGSACVLKGGSDADFSNRAIVKVIHGVLERFGVTPDVVVLLPAEREATAALLQARGYVDLLIPRGSSALIQYVRESARIPVIETGAGVCHAYFDVDGDVRKGAAIVNNAKTRRVSVCNALDSVLIHASRLSDLPQLCAPLQESRVRIYADSRALTALQGHYPADLLEAATEKHFGTEFMDYKMAVKTVDSLDEALAHIARFGSGHSECIITENADATEKFLQLVDAACVYANAPTSFTDGAQFGLGAEIGISTQKLHARGPMALEEITTYKWFVQGDGQVRPK
jgi:glutamate-5-semialdehyde dehydrogenase